MRYEHTHTHSLKTHIFTLRLPDIWAFIQFTWLYAPKVSRGKINTEQLYYIWRAAYVVRRTVNPFQRTKQHAHPSSLSSIYLFSTRTVSVHNAPSPSLCTASANYLRDWWTISWRLALWGVYGVMLSLQLMNESKGYFCGNYWLESVSRWMEELRDHLKVSVG